MAHITGGGITENLPRVLPEGCAAEIDLQSWAVPPLFRLLQQRGADRDRRDVPRVQHGRRAGRWSARRATPSRDRHRAARAAGEPNAVRLGCVVAGERSVDGRTSSLSSYVQMRDGMTPARLGVLISGRGSNLQSIIDAIASGAARRRRSPWSSRTAPDAAGLQRAREAGIEALCLNPRDYPDRDAYDARAGRDPASRATSTSSASPGFMRLVGQPLLDAFPERILNIHPSLLPAFPGLDAQRQALEHGVRVTGATVHLVTSELDGGPIVLQAAVPVRSGDTVETLAARILVEEHRLYPEAIRLVLAGGWVLQGRRFLPAQMP